MGLAVSSLLGVVNGVREAFHGLRIATGMQVLEAMMEADREVLCGPKRRHQVERTVWRGGSVDSQVALGGRQVELPRLRVRSADGEVPLVSFQWAAGDLKEGTYRPRPVRQVLIPKKQRGKFRPLGIPCLRDRVAQTAAMLVLSPIFEA